MKKKIAFLVLALGCGMAGADELSDGIKAWERQDYAQAHRIFNKLAEAGNPEAQRQLGEMVGFGEGVPENLATARSWLERSKAAGNKDASESLALVERRASHKAEIQRYVSGYDGSDLALANYHCEKPTPPEASTTKREINKVHGQFTGWYECYGRFVNGLQAAIPPETAAIMNSAEQAQARAHMEGTLARIAAQGKAEAEAVSAAERTWVAATEKKVKANDEIAKLLVDRDKTQFTQNVNTFESRQAPAIAAQPSPGRR